jgi:hypothetical protein
MCSIAVVAKLCHDGAHRATELPWVAARRATMGTEAKLGLSEDPPVCRKEEVWIANWKEEV